MTKFSDRRVPYIIITVMCYFFLVFMVKTHNKKVQDCVIKKLTEILTQNKKQTVQRTVLYLNIY